MRSIDESNYSASGKPLLPAALWLAQLLLAGMYLASGVAVIFLPAPELAAILPWTVHMPETLLKFIGGVDLAAGLGVLLPSLTRIAPRLTVVTTLCSAALQALAILSHALIGALPAPLLINLSVLALSLFVAWGRSSKAWIEPRRLDRRMAEIDVFAGAKSDGSEASVHVRRRGTAGGRKNRACEVVAIRRGLRDAPFIVQSGKNHGKKAA